MLKSTEFADAPYDRSQPRSTSGQLRVLAAEDVAVNRELIRLFLEPQGYLIDTVCDGFEAVEAITRLSYDVVIMDMQMPGMDGLEATRAIRALGGVYAEIPIIALSANIIADQIQMCLDAGMTAHVPKPFTSQDLVTAIERWSRRPEKSGNMVLSAFAAQAGWASVRGLLDMLNAQIAAFENCSRDDVENLRHHAHALRGAAGSLGYEGLAAVCRELEQVCHAAGEPGSILGLAHKAASVTKREIAAELARAA